AIPAKDVRERGGRSRRKRITPQNWPEKRLGKLIFVANKKGNAVLIAVKKYKRKSPKRTVAFILVRQTRLRKRLDIGRAERRALNLLPRLIQKHYKDD
ncbi:MAG: DUF6441 family protein, partial [Candidatus Hinthialibacter sp.]